MARRVLPHPAGRFAATGFVPLADVLKLRLSLKRRRSYIPRSPTVKQWIDPRVLSTIGNPRSLDACEPARNGV